jgi:NAD(P)-dependent dehydrogenase (short-subunit alcohol dehydrogenase family)
MSRFPDKRIAITGAASGLGRALALQYAKMGWRVAIGDINDAQGAEALAEVKKSRGDAFYQRVDVRDAASIEAWKDAIVARWGGLDVVVNNAGVATHGSIDKSSLEDWDWVVDINLMGVVRGCKTFSTLFKQQGSGHVVNVASMAGLIHSPEMNSYNVTKAGVVALSETIKPELKPYGIGVTLVCPAFFRTNLGSGARSPDPGISKRINRLLEMSKITAEDIALMTYEAVAARKFLVLPHKEYARVWYMKRLVPRYYFWHMEKAAARLYKKVLDAEAAEGGRA